IHNRVPWGRSVSSPDRKERRRLTARYRRKSSLLFLFPKQEKQAAFPTKAGSGFVVACLFRGSVSHILMTRAANTTGPPRRKETTMLTAEGCRRRRERLWQQLDPPHESDYLLLGDPTHLAYLANCWMDPISYGA